MNSRNSGAVESPNPQKMMEQLKSENEVLRLKVAEFEKELENAHSTKNWANRRAKHSLDLQKEKDKEVERLRELLKKCKDIIEWYKADTGYVYLPTENILTRINAAIGENEITIDDIVVSGIDGNGNEFLIYYPDREHPNSHIGVSNDHKKQEYTIYKRVPLLGHINNDILIKKEKDKVLYPSEFVKFLNDYFNNESEEK